MEEGRKERARKGGKNTGACQERGFEGEGEGSRKGGLSTREQM